MSTETRYLDATKNGIGDIAKMAPDLKKAIELGKEQAKTRDEIIDIINHLCDTLQHGGDEVIARLSACVVEYYKARDGAVEDLYAYFERLAHKFSEPSLRDLLHEGKVCGELHKLGDRFKQPFSEESPAALSFSQNVRTFFSRSSNMKEAIDGLVEGERHYLRDIAAVLRKVVTEAEDARAEPFNTLDRVATSGRLRVKGDIIVTLLKTKRKLLDKKFSSIRQAGDVAVETLH